MPAGRVTVPLKLGDAKFAFRFKAVCWAVDTGLFASLVSFTLLKPTIAAVMPETVPVKVGLASGAFSESAVVMVDAYDWSLFSAVANSLKVSKAAGAAPTTF